MDRIADMMNMLKIASVRGHESIVVPASAIKFAIAECLVKEGFVKSVAKKIRHGRDHIEITLMYENGKPRIADVKRISKPSCRVYNGAKDIRQIKNGHGITVLSTPKGILSGKVARKEQVGGEVLFTLW